MIGILPERRADRIQCADDVAERTPGRGQPKQIVRRRLPRGGKAGEIVGGSARVARAHRVIRRFTQKRTFLVRH